MSEPKHTPGPWKAKDNYIYAPIPDEDDIFTISIAVACAGVAPAISNANLIAAAPDMYEALKNVCHNGCRESTADEFCLHCYVAKALRKARGEGE